MIRLAALMLLGFFTGVAIDVIVSERGTIVFIWSEVLK